jgi:hypothetical protein
VFGISTLTGAAENNLGVGEWVRHGLRWIVHVLCQDEEDWIFFW